MSDSPTFLFATCRAGSEKSLKQDVQNRYGSRLTPAFMRPQLITFKCIEAVQDRFELESVFARSSGISVGRANTIDDLPTLVSGFRHPVQHVHVYPREVPEDGVEASIWEKIDVLITEINAKLNITPQPLKAGDGVLDIIIEPEAEKPLFVGFHFHTNRRTAVPGAIPRVTTPPEAPSRAWLKLEQALAWAGWDKESDLRGKRVVDLGCAPGGATYALLQRGAKVIGIDTAEMDPKLLKYVKDTNAWFRHFQITAGDLPFNALPEYADMIICDINLPPPIIITYVERIHQRVQAGRMILTLKLNDAEVEAGIPSFIGRLRSFAPSPIRAVQLPANRTEICVFAGE